MVPPFLRTTHEMLQMGDYLAIISEITEKISV